MATARVAFLDIETAPEVAYIWKRFKETVGQTQIREDGYVLCVAWSMLDDPDIHCSSLYGNREWRAGRHNDDRSVIRAAWNLLDASDIVVGHNVRTFDVATLNARFIKHGLPPPRPYKIVDTLEVLKKQVRLPSNSLESASHAFGIETKTKQHFELWRDCMAGKRQAWRDLVAYCKHDVIVLRQLYYKLQPWMDRHPNMALYEGTGRPATCPKCGGARLQRRGLQPTSVAVYARYQCQDCGGWCRGRHLDKDYDRSHVMQHAVTT